MAKVTAFRIVYGGDDWRDAHAAVVYDRATAEKLADGYSSSDGRTAHVVEVEVEYRPCRFCGAHVTATRPGVDYCRACYYRAEHHTDSRSEQLDYFAEQLPGSNVGIDHLGGGCFCMGFHWAQDTAYYMATVEGFAELPSDEAGLPVRDGWGYVARYDGDDDCEGTTLLDGDGFTDADVVAAIRADRARRGLA